MGKKADISSDLKASVGLTIGDTHLDLGLDDINLDMGLDDINFDVGGAVTADIGLGNIKADIGLDNVNLDVGLHGDRGQPVAVDADLKAQMMLLGNEKQPVTLDMGLDNIKADFGLDNIKAAFSFALTAIPLVRVHLPFKFEFGFGLFGINILNFSVCSEAMIITENNANP